MKRADLEAKLRALGWSPAGASGANHTKWKHPRRNGVIAIPHIDILHDSTAERLIIDAGE